MRRFAAIDIGSNAMRLRMVEALHSERARPTFVEIGSVRAPVRLGADVFERGELSADTLRAAGAALRDFRAAMDAEGITSYRAVATSASREAKNGHVLVERARREAKLDLEIIDGAEEARLLQLALAEPRYLEAPRVLLIDVGGGSTEFTLLEQGEKTASISLPLGTVRLLQLIGSGVALSSATHASAAHASTTHASAAHASTGWATVNDKAPSRRDLALLDQSIRAAMFQLKKTFGGTKAIRGALLVGTGGNVDALARLTSLPPGSEPSGTQRPSRILTRELHALCQSLAELSSHERMQRFQLRADRADTILPASRIFLHASDLAQAEAIEAPGVGLKEGLLLDLATREQEGARRDRLLSSCYVLGERCRFDAEHANRVLGFVRTLAEALSSHREKALTKRDVELLEAGAVLHDIGEFVHRDGHHKHGYYLALHAELDGLKENERRVLANIIRYHRKGAPEASHTNFAELEKNDKEQVRRLAGVLRVADALDRLHIGNVAKLKATLNSDQLELTITGQETDLEEWSAFAKGDLLRDTFGITLRIVREN
jgi:exopolyphosphatase / guanosine-5'-triphosphate,3'-diphosphate pyrophosphatase